MQFKVSNWQFMYDGFYWYFCSIMVFNALNFAMNIFAVHMLERMSRATWSEKHGES